MKPGDNQLFRPWQSHIPHRAFEGQPDVEVKAMEPEDVNMFDASTANFKPGNKKLPVKTATILAPDRRKITIHMNPR